MKRLVIAWLAVSALCAGAPRAAAGPLLFEWGVNVGGTIYDEGTPLPGTWNDAAFDDTTGLGVLVGVVSGAGAHQVAAYFDIEIDEDVNTFFNEIGEAAGVAPAFLSWEIDEPGFACLDWAGPGPCERYTGDIYDHFLAGTLDNAVGTPDPDDVAVALGAAFTLAAGEIGLVTFRVGTTRPADGFYLRHRDLAPVGAVGMGGSDLYYTLSLVKRGQPIPEPAALLLLGTGLLAAGRRLRRR